MTKKKYETPCINVLTPDSSIVFLAGSGEAINELNRNNNFETGTYASGNGWLNNSPTGGIQFEDAEVDPNTGEISW